GSRLSVIFQTSQPHYCSCPQKDLFSMANSSSMWAADFPLTNCNYGFIPPPVGSRNWRQRIQPHLSFLIYWRATLANRFSRFHSGNVGLPWRNSPSRILNQLARSNSPPRQHHWLRRKNGSRKLVATSMALSANVSMPLMPRVNARRW